MTVRPMATLTLHLQSVGAALDEVSPIKCKHYGDHLRLRHPKAISILPEPQVTTIILKQRETGSENLRYLFYPLVLMSPAGL